MAYKEAKSKKYYKRSKSNRGGYRTASSYAGKAGMHLVKEIGVGYLKKALGLNTENKNWDSTSVQLATGTFASTYFPTQNLSQGVTNQQRVGNGLRVTHFKWRGAIATAGGALNVQQQRVRVVWTLQTKVGVPGSYLSAAQVFETPANLDTPYNTDLQDCKILSDKTYLLTPYTAQIAQQICKFKWSPSYNDGHVRWTDADVGGLNINQTEGLIQMFVISDQLANQPTITGYGRVHFVDN